jgi:hypothetical protein
VCDGVLRCVEDEMRVIDRGVVRMRGMNSRSGVDMDGGKMMSSAVCCYSRPKLSSRATNDLEHLARRTPPPDRHEIAPPPPAG